MRTSLVLTVALVGATALASCDEKKKAPEPEKPKAGGPAEKKPAAAKKEASKAPPLPAVPKGLQPVKAPEDNPTTPAKVALGQKLFFDERLSSDGSRACYSCHQNEQGTGGELPTAIGAEEKPLTRHAPVMWNVAYLPRLYWDGRADSLEAQAMGAWTGGNMGVGKDNVQKKADELGKIEEYRDLFYAAFPGKGLTPTTVTQAIAAYERTLLCGDTAFDKFNGGDASALNEAQKKGWDLFKGEAGCHECHTPPMFSDAYASKDGAYHNIGIGFEGKKKEEVDPGRQKVTENPADFAMFKTPTLRNVTKSAPYFHDGSVAELKDAVKFMAGGGYDNPDKDPKLKDRELSDEDIDSLVAFLGAIECPETLEKPKLPK